MIVDSDREIKKETNEKVGEGKLGGSLKSPFKLSFYDKDSKNFTVKKLKQIVKNN